MKNSAGIIISRVSRLLAAAMILAFSVSAFASQAEDQADRIQKAYEGIKDIKGSFIQKNFVKDLKRTDTYNGKFFIKPPKMKWEYSGQMAQVIYINSDEILIYQPKNNQVIKGRFDRATYGQAPIALLAGLGDLKKEFEILQSSSDRLVIKPKKPMGNIDHVEITPSEGGFPIKAITIIDKLSNRVEITLKDVKTNTGIGNSIFNFTPPKNAAIMEQ